MKESRLRELFSKHGDITQIKLLSKRRFAYVGFMTESSAKAAVEYRNETFIDATQIEVGLQWLACSFNIAAGVLSPSIWT